MSDSTVLGLLLGYVIMAAILIRVMQFLNPPKRGGRAKAPK